MMYTQAFRPGGRELSLRHQMYPTGQKRDIPPVSTRLELLKTEVENTKQNTSAIAKEDVLCTLSFESYSILNGRLFFPDFQVR